MSLSRSLLDRIPLRAGQPFTMAMLTAFSALISFASTVLPFSTVAGGGFPHDSAGC